MDSSILIAHRGDNTHYPENTLIAIEMALKAGATAFEFDVQMNGDRRLVAFHDEDFLRMNGESDKNIVDVTDSEMKGISIHEPNQFGNQYFPTSVTLIDEILELLKRYPNVKAYVEIKDESLSFWGIQAVMSELLKKLEGFEQQATVISFNQSALVYTREHSKLKIGLVFEDFSEPMKATAIALNPEYMITWYKVLPEEELWKGNWQWMIYTVNDLALAKQLQKREDIDFIETDDIQMMLKG